MNETRARRVRILAVGAVVAALAAPLGIAMARPSLTPQTLCGKAGSGSATASPDGLRVGTFNVLNGRDDALAEKTLEARMKIQLDQIAASKADIIGLQDVTESTNHGRVIARMAEGLVDRTGGSWYWCFYRTEPHVHGVIDFNEGGGDPAAALLARRANHPDSNWYSGEAVLSRWPIIASDAHRLHADMPQRRLAENCKVFNEPTCLVDVVLTSRSAVWTRIATPFGNVTATSSETSGQTLQQKNLSKWIRKHAVGNDKATLLLCDCHVNTAFPSHYALKAQGWVDTFARVGGTGGTVTQAIGSVSNTVRNRVDFVYSYQSKLKVAGSQRFMNTPANSGLTSSGKLWPSDHFGIGTLLTP